MNRQPHPSPDNKSKTKEKKARKKEKNNMLRVCMDITESLRTQKENQRNERNEENELTFTFPETAKTPSPVPPPLNGESYSSPEKETDIPDTIIEMPSTPEPQTSEDSIFWVDQRGFKNYEEAPELPLSMSRPDSAMSENTVRMREKGAKVAGGANGIFTRRLDFSSFNSLPKIKLNSYQIKTEDEGNHGNDDTRCFILSTLASHNRSKVQCVLCEEYLLVFDRYPLVDGTFFLSPRQHAKFCIEVKVEGRTQFLTCVCMGCLEGTLGRQVFCRYCNTRWDGSSLVLGTMYSYDIFAAMPCCTERIKCNSCVKPVLHPAQRLNYFSDYSHMVPCPHCRTLDTHFVKSLPFCFIQRPARTFSQWP